MCPIRLTVSEGVGILTLENPPQNLITYDMFRHLGEIVTELDQEPDVRAVLICGAGEELFSAGLDLKEFVKIDRLSFGRRHERAAMAYRMIRTVDDALGRIARSPKPYICAMKGLAYSSALELAAACDIRVASETTTFAIPELGHGLMPGSGGTKRLTRLVGLGRMKKWVLTGETLDAKEAYRIGLVDVLCPPGREMLQAHAIGRAIAEKAPLAVRNAKYAIDRGWDAPLEDAVEMEARLVTELVASDDAIEGILAFLERRPPQFQGR